MIREFLAIAAAVPALAIMSNAQDEGQIRLMKMDAEKMAAQAKIVSVRGAVMNRTVKNAPYSATETTESNQTLADGTRIHNETQVQVYRDSQGRTRRESPDEVTIFDPVAKVSYMLNPKEQTARQLPMGGGLFYVSQDGKAGTFTMKMPPPPLPPPLPDSEDMAKAKAEKDVAEKGAADAKVITRTFGAVGAGNMAIAGVARGPETGVFFHKEVLEGTPESLGTQNIEGVTAQGTRTTTTIPVNAIGNDRPLQIVNERWYSPDLQMVVQSRFSDPRTGEETFRVTNISRGEPAQYLFEVPAGYQMVK